MTTMFFWILAHWSAFSSEDRDGRFLLLVSIYQWLYKASDFWRSTLSFEFEFTVVKIKEWIDVLKPTNKGWEDYFDFTFWYRGTLKYINYNKIFNFILCGTSSQNCFVLEWNMVCKINPKLMPELVRATLY
jgi:hypothetical protein